MTRTTPTAGRTTATEALFAQISRATPDEARTLSMMLSSNERAEMVLFCYTRVHAREHGRAIASACTRENLFQVGGYAGAALYDQCQNKDDTWAAAVVFAKKPISLAG